MVTRKGYVLQNKTARAILDELNLYAKDKQFYPVKFALFRYMRDGETDKSHKYTPGRYPELTQGSFNYWFDRLVAEGYIEIDWTTRAIRCVHLMIVEREDFPLP